MFAIEGIVVDDDITYWTKIFKKKRKRPIYISNSGNYGLSEINLLAIKRKIEKSSCFRRNRYYCAEFPEQKT